jgi:hypothetical protein
MASYENIAPSPIEEIEMRQDGTVVPKWPALETVIQAERTPPHRKEAVSLRDPAD